MKRKSPRLSLSKETLRTLDSDSLENVAGGTTLVLLLTLECVALTYAAYKIAKSQ